MTKEEAIEILSDVGDINRCCAKDAEALDMAIKALEQQPCEDWKFYYNHGYAQAKRDLAREVCDDCISRAVALIAIEKEKQGWELGETRYAIDECYKVIAELPSVDDITAWMPLQEFIEKLRAKE